MFMFEENKPFTDDTHKHTRVQLPMNLFTILLLKVYIFSADRSKIFHFFSSLTLPLWLNISDTFLVEACRLFLSIKQMKMVSRFVVVNRM